MSASGLDAYAEALRAGTATPGSGLPDAVFAFALAVVPMTNVDLLIRDEAGRVLLAWREDQFGRGWHIPGGIIRVRERFADRIAAVALAELGTRVAADAAPCRVEELVTSERGHFISLLFRCRLIEPLDSTVFAAVNPPRAGQLRWIGGMPDPLYPAHSIYADLLATGRV